MGETGLMKQVPELAKECPGMGDKVCHRTSSDRGGTISQTTGESVILYIQYYIASRQSPGITHSS